jgi:hypothetical protein
MGNFYHTIISRQKKDRRALGGRRSPGAVRARGISEEGAWGDVHLTEKGVFGCQRPVPFLLFPSWGSFCYAAVRGCPSGIKNCLGEYTSKRTSRVWGFSSFSFIAEKLF